jgi:hypothetical protein
MRSSRLFLRDRSETSRRTHANATVDERSGDDFIRPSPLI